MKINQYCSVCKKHLDMEVIPTDDAGDDGVIWLRCPQCQGFLPKFSGDGSLAVGGSAPDEAADQTPARGDGEPDAASPPADDPSAPGAPGRQPAAGEAVDEAHEGGPGPDREGDDDSRPDAAERIEDRSEPHDEYAALLAAADLDRARPYRPTESYEVGDVLHHLAYGDIGIVVAKDRLPGGRRAVKVFFEAAGVVHLIEQSPADGR